MVDDEIRMPDEVIFNRRHYKPYSPYFDHDKLSVQKSSFEKWEGMTLDEMLDSSDYTSLESLVGFFVDHPDNRAVDLVPNMDEAT